MSIKKTALEDIAIALLMKLAVSLRRCPSLTSSQVY
jgi:hypothetical protein